MNPNTPNPSNKKGQIRDFYSENIKHQENKVVENARLRTEIEDKNKEIYTFQPNADKVDRPRNSSRSRIESHPSVNHKNYHDHKKYIELKVKEKYFEPEVEYTFKPTINKK